MKSKFSWTAYIPAFIAVVILAGLTGLVAVSFDPAVASLLVVLIPVIVFAVLVLLWLIYGEARAKIIRIEMDFDHLTIRRYFGLSAPATFYYADLTGFTITILPATNTSYEYLYIKQGDKNIGKLSEFYHKNYDDLKADLRTHLKDLGYADFSYWKEVKEIFG